ncbi:MAG: hypothetical protein NTV80_06820 [Verrucomicrobia bacterium]|nr:hypothetical protein [Verrucomicrobiota bacterium]
MPSNILESPFVPDPSLELAMAEWTASQIVPLKEMPSEAFLVQARAVARRAESLRDLRLGIDATGFLPLSLPEYLATAATRVGVQLGRLLPSSAFGQFVAAPSMALARAVGMTKEDLRLLTRLWIAETFSKEWRLMPVLARGDSSMTSHSYHADVQDSGMDKQTLATKLASFDACYDE